MQIIQAVIREIERGRLTSGTYLPSSRELAAGLGVNRKTVVLAYEDLIAQGWLATSNTRGTRVSDNLPERKLVEPRDQEPRLDRVGYKLDIPPERMLSLPEGIGPKIDEGTPDGRLFPPELLVRANRAATNRLSRSNRLDYRDPRGSVELRRSIAEMLRAQRGLLADESNICITRGSQHGIFLASMALLQRGDTVVVENLTYEPAVAAFRALGADVVAVGLDQGGINVDELDRLCSRRKVKATFVTPHHQFPTTVAMRPDRRLRLIELARNHGFAIIEDDYDHEFHFQSQPLLPLASYAPDQVVYVGSMSKLLLPSLRIGYVAGPDKLIGALAHTVSLIDGMGNSITEDMVAQLIESGEVRRHSRKAWKIYAERRESFARTLSQELGDRIEFAIPDGGLAFWVRFHGDLVAIEARARKAGLRFASSGSYRMRSDAPSGLRVGFASLNEQEARVAVATLAEATG
jgi:GntR family transcriptional regulator/MocR family aminotransferase